MKKLLTIALCAAAVSAFADPTEVELGEVGVTEIKSALTNTIVAVSYDDLAGGTGMVCSNLVKTTNLTAGDSLIEFRDGKYTGWILEEDTETRVKYWKEQLGTFVDSAGKQLTLVSSPADTVTNMVGTGIWLVRKNPTNATTKEPVPFYIYGKPVADPISNIASNKWTLIGNPKQELVEIGTNKVVGASYLDELVVPAEGGKLCRYQFKDGKGWRTTGSDGKWVDNAPPKLDAGLGCWILTQKNASITW